MSRYGHDIAATIVVSALIILNFGNAFFAGREAGIHYLLLTLGPLAGCLIFSMSGARNAYFSIGLTIVGVVLGLYA